MNTPTAAFGGGITESVVNPVVLTLILFAGVLMLVLPRWRVIAPFFAGAMVIPYDQILVIGPLHFMMVRVLLLFGFVRMISTKLFGKEEILPGGMNGIDKAVLVLGIFTGIDGVLLWQASGEIIYQLGVAYNSLGAYFFLRFLIRDEEDVVRALRVWAWVVVPIAGIMIGEQLLGKNLLYTAIGGAHAWALITTGSRNGTLRAAGSFSHPILAGTFGGFSLPLFIGLWWKSRKDRTYAWIGGLGSLVMAVTTGSTTALMALIASVVALCFWPLRKQMRAVRWAFVGLLVADELRFKSHFWHIIMDIDFTGNSSSYHRYELVNQCIIHFWDWALVGTKDFASWGWNMGDLANQFVATADNSGLIPLASLIAIVVIGFKYLGRARCAAAEKHEELFIWAIGASLFANLVGFFGISYFDQTTVGWYALLATICAVTLPVRSQALKRTEAAEPAFVFNRHPVSALSRHAGATVPRAGFSDQKLLHSSEKRSS